MSGHIPSSLTNLLDLFTTHPHKPSVLKCDVDVDQMVEHVVDVVDPKIRVIGRYAHKLMQPLSHTWDYLTDMADMVPDGVTLSSVTYSDDPRMKAIFSTQAVVQQLLGTIEPLLHEKQNNVTPGQVYMLLSMEKKESSFLGAEINGDIIRRDVLQTKVTFSNRKFLSAGYDENDARLGYKRCALEGLLHKAHDLVLQSRNEQRQLIERKRELHHQLHATGKILPKDHSFIFTRNDYLDDAPPELIEIERQLTEMRIKSDSPDYHLDQIIEVLKHPEQYLRMESQSMVLSNLGVKLSGKTMDAGVNIDYAEVEVENELKRVTMIVNSPVEEIHSIKV